MILRKPYAFLMKHFKKINFVLFLLATYIFVSTLSLLNYASDYASGNTNDIDLILQKFSSTYFFVLVLILVITVLLLYLLKRKDKPIKTYLFVLVEYILFFIMSIYMRNYFDDFLIHGYDKAIARTIYGFIRVLSIPQYFVLLLLLIRAIGLDLNSFGFRKDQELLAGEEDREEVEVEVGFDKDQFVRKSRMYFRQIQYFLQEKKIYVIIVFSILLLITGFFGYRYFYITHKIYHMNQTVTSNYYKFQVHHSYITTRDYRGDTIANGKSYVIIDLDVKNTLDSTRTLDIEKFLLYVDNDYYVPTVNFNNRFEDLGPVFEKQSLAAHEKDNYYLIYEIDTPKENSKFLLKYQDIVGTSGLIRIKLQIQDISSFIVKDTKSLTEELMFPINKETTRKIQLTSFEIGEEFPYTYEECLVNNCPIYGGYTKPKEGRKVLYLKLNPLDSTTQDLLEDFVRYGTMRYVIDGKTYQEKVKSSVSKIYKGNYFYFDVHSNIETATSIEIVLTIRNNQYIYKLK